MNIEEVMLGNQAVMATGNPYHEHNGLKITVLDRFLGGAYVLALPDGSDIPIVVPGKAQVKPQ